MESQVEQNRVNSDEIDLTELLRSVFDTKYWVLAAICVFSVGFWALQFTKGIVVPPTYTYETRISFQFKGVDEGEYPNESPFSLGDVISPAVTSSVYDSSGLSEYISLEQFQSALTVKPYTPDRTIILGKYEGQLANKKLSVAEVEQLQDRIRVELDRSSRGSAVIAFSGDYLQEIPEKLIENVLLRIPKEWARYMTEQIGVGEIQEPVYSSSVLNESALADMDYLIAFELLLDRLDLLQRNVEVLRELPNGTVLRDEVSGYALPDLEKAISDIKRYRVAPLVNPVRSLGIAKNPELVELYFENELIELGRELTLLKTKKANISEAYASYLNTQTKTSRQGLDSAQMVTIEPQIFDKLVELTNSGADIEYRQELNTSFLMAADKISDVEAEIERINQILESMKGQNSATQALRENYSNQVNSQLPEIVEMLVVCFDASERIYKKLSYENLGMGNELFRYSDGELGKIVSRTIFSFSNFRLFLILSFLVVILVIPTVMVVRAVKK